MNLSGFDFRLSAKEIYKLYPKYRNYELYEVYFPFCHFCFDVTLYRSIMGFGNLRPKKAVTNVIIDSVQGAPYVYEDFEPESFDSRDYLVIEERLTEEFLRERAKGYAKNHMIRKFHTIPDLAERKQQSFYMPAYILFDRNRTEKNSLVVLDGLNGRKHKALRDGVVQEKATVLETGD